jgi:murein DD-endopeptidase MepM/ murein hydrolase activator NlpD
MQPSRSTPPERTKAQPHPIRRFVTASLCAVAVVFGIGAAPEADDRLSVNRSGAPGHFDAIPIDALPVHRPLFGSTRDLIEVYSDPMTQRDPVASSSDRAVVGRLSPGQSMARVLSEKGVPGATIGLIDREMRAEFDFRRSQPGDRFRLIRADDGDVISFRYWVDSEESILLFRDGNGFGLRRERAVLEPRTARLDGVVKGSLYHAIQSAGENPSLATAFSEVFAWDLDFSRQLRTGDRFEIVYEKLYRASSEGGSEYVRPGRILAARFQGSAGDYTAIYFEEGDGFGSYFRPDGSVMDGSYLAAPVAYSRIASPYSGARRHPILKIVRPHHGIDYAAPEGAPVWSVADGKVIYRGWSGGFGNLVKIRHANGYVSYYAHLSGFGKGLKVGSTVEQKQVIGYVGETGLATGPHVCFRVTQNGRYVNPLVLDRSVPKGRLIDDESWAEFELVRDELLTGLSGGAVELARNPI